jgi:hypothetical protein
LTVPRWLATLDRDGAPGGRWPKFHQPLGQARCTARRGAPMADRRRSRGVPRSGPLLRHPRRGPMGAARPSCWPSSSRSGRRSSPPSRTRSPPSRAVTDRRSLIDDGERARRGGSCVGPRQIGPVAPRPGVGRSLTPGHMTHEEGGGEPREAGGGSAAVAWMASRSAGGPGRSPCSRTVALSTDGLIGAPRTPRFSYSRRRLRD